MLVIFRSSDKPALGIRPLLPFGDEKHFGRIDGPKPVHTAELVADPVLRIYDVFYCVLQYTDLDFRVALWLLCDQLVDNSSKRPHVE